VLKVVWGGLNFERGGGGGKMRGGGPTPRQFEHCFYAALAAPE